MHKRSQSILGLLMMGGVVACGGPFVNFPGGALSGALEPAPKSWVATNEIDTIQFESNPVEPYSVNIWVVALGAHLYVHSGDNRTQWVENIEADPKVRLQVEDTVYELVAERVTDQSEFDRFGDAYADKYYGRPGNEVVSEVYVFRLSAR